MIEHLNLHLTQRTIKNGISSSFSSSQAVSASSPSLPQLPPPTVHDQPLRLLTGRGAVPPHGMQTLLHQREWKDKEEEILRDIGPLVMLTTDILYSPWYMDGDLLTVEDEKIVVEKLLPYHPDYEDKIGCGIESIMVDHHPEFRWSRCLFVVRTDGSWIDFSYNECLRKYIRDKYPTHAERFTGEHFIRRKMRI